ncbi:hypothetical protein NBRC3257_1307 [Gluconobacter thailandicus NBRC 3257]|uniref:Uncharacterized protein n=1 Tax=Gluconobacter thailandicus NBRC 3257 TaxID=1381097 RepID=A0ABQ0IVR2_GLUTH|nr:hypothetical protein AD946_07645 [Gluconobacter thailandicus]GAD26308.1 hypothetical protein NBRC3257_1307 [Gluconobacter thailandicus NBRC 3257]
MTKRRRFVSFDPTQERNSKTAENCHSSPDLASHASDASDKTYYRPTRAYAYKGYRENPTHVTHPTQGDELDAIAAVVRRLLPDHRNPEAFHLAKADAVWRIRRLARRIRAGH